MLHFFFNGGVENKFKGEDRILVPSPKVSTYDVKPEMAAYEVTSKLVEQIKSNKYDLIVANYANPDMVGHTGNFDAAVKAVEVIDECIGDLIKVIVETNGVMIITADHGNVEMMLDEETGQPHTSHTTGPVPFVIIGGDVKSLKDGRLCDIAPTILDIMAIEKPEIMDGESLLGN